MNFLSMSSLKEQLGCSTVSIVKNPNSGKLFAETDTNLKLKVQQNIDLNSTIKFMYDSEISEGCLINAKENTENVLVVL